MVSSRGVADERLLHLPWSTQRPGRGGILLVAIIGASFASDNINIDNSGNNGGNIHQSVNINNQDQTANVNLNNGWNSWNTMWDYGRGLFAARLVSRRVCVVSRMNKNVMPSLEQLRQGNQEQSNALPQSLTYTISQIRVKNVATFGRHIESLCKGVPTFYAQEVQGEGDMFFSLQDCSNINILRFLGITFCGNIGC